MPANRGLARNRLHDASPSTVWTEPSCTVESPPWIIHTRSPESYSHLVRAFACPVEYDGALDFAILAKPPWSVLEGLDLVAAISADETFCFATAAHQVATVRISKSLQGIMSLPSSYKSIFLPLFVILQHVENTCYCSGQTSACLGCAEG